MGFVIGVGSFADIIIRSGGAAADWWDPNTAGLSAIAAYRAISSVGTPWPGGPANYAASLVNQANPGTNDLVAGNGAVPWAQATGWGFVAAALQYFDTGLLPANDQSWSMVVSFDAVVVDGFVAGMRDAANREFGLRPARLAAGILYANGGNDIAAPQLLTGSVGVSGDNGYRNGVLDVTLIPAWGAAAASSIFIGCRNQGGVAAVFVSSNIHSVAIYDAGPAAVQAEVVAIVAAQNQL